MTINGVYFAITAVTLAVVGVGCYLWGRSDEREAWVRKLYGRGGAR